MKRILKIGLSFILCISIFACSNKDKEGYSEDFAKYVDTLPEVLLGNSSTYIQSLFDDPKAYGIEVEEYTLDYTSREDYADAMDSIKEIKKKLESFDYDDLSNEQKITYDVIMNYVDLEEESEDFYYLATNYFDVNSGVQSNLPLELWTFGFKDQLSLDSFLSILQSTPDMFKKYIELEKERQEKGYGMSQTYLDDVIEGFTTFNQGDHTYIINTANEKIDAVDFLDDKEKQEYKDKILEAYENKFLPSYVYAQQELSNIQSTAKEDASLADYKDGKDYYTYLIQSYTGFESVDEYLDFLDEQESKIYKKAMKVMSKNSGIDENSLASIQYTDIDNINDLLKYLEDEVNEGDIFPELDELDYHMEVVPEALRPIFQASAAYFLSAYDNLKANEKMILNGDYSQSDYNSVAHEGFPGHMYQHNYFKTVDHHIVRDILSNLGYVEGWATYSAAQACAYAEDEGGCEFMEINNDLVYLYILKLDVMIHYDDITRQEAYDYLSNYFGLNDEEQLSDQFEQLLENPAIFATYYGGKYQIENLKNEAEEAWGDDYSDKRFNEAILNYGPISYNLLNKYMEEQFK